MKALFTTAVLLILFAMTGLATAQNNSYVLLDKSTMEIDGTSTIHDWTCEVEEMNTSLEITGNELSKKPNSELIQSFSLTIPVKAIESGKGGMNKKIYKALKEKKNPTINFNITTAEVTEYDSTSSSVNMNVTGELNIADVTRTITLPVKSTIQDNNTYKFVGSYDLNMKDYNIDPPSAVFGTIKSGEEVTISFELFFSAENPM